MNLFNDPIINTRGAFVDDAKVKADIRSQMVFRYCIIGFAVLFLYAFRSYLPFPYPHFFLVAAVDLAVNAVLHASAAKKRWRNRVNNLFPYVDALIAGPVFLFSGGFISPFVISNIASNIGSVIIYTNNRNLALHTFCILFCSYLAVAVLQKTGLVPVYVGYAATAISNGFFFAFVVIVTSFIIIASYVLIHALNFRVHMMLDEMSAAFLNIVSGTSPVAGKDFFSHLARSCAETLHVDSVIIGELVKKGQSMQVLAKAGADGSVENGQTVPVSGSLFGEILARGGLALENGAGPGAAEKWLTVGSEPWSLFGTALKDSAGRPIGIFCLVNSGPIPRQYLVEPVVTVFTSRAGAELERKIIADRQMQTEQQLAQAHKMSALGQLAGGIAHDFNNMLAVMSGYAGILCNKLDELSPHRKTAGMILATTARAAEILGPLSRFVRRERLEWALLDVHETIHETVAMLERTIVKNIRIEKKLSAAQPEVMGDRTLLQNVLVNLAINARDAMEGRSGCITFATGTAAIGAEHPLRAAFNIATGDYMMIEVADTGSGMSADTMSHLFEPFFTTKPKGKGTGLGLANVWGYIENYKGAIEVKSEEGKGSSFLLYLPRTVDQGGEPGAKNRGCPQG